MNKPFSQAAENNKGPILEILQQQFQRADTVLEIGSGTGQHAQYFAGALSQLKWYPSDIAAQMESLTRCLQDTRLPNLQSPIVLDVCEPCWPVEKAGGVFTANTLHIMPWDSVPCLFRGVGRILERGGRLCIYGPFKYGGAFTTQSNADFDRWLKTQLPHQGIRDIEAVNALAADQGLSLIHDHAMPANNQLLCWEMA